MGYFEEAESILRRALKDPNLLEVAWDARRELVGLLLDQVQFDEAMSEARLLTELGSCRAASYDELRRVAEAAGNRELADSMKHKGDQVYEEELKLFKSLRTLIE